MSIEATPGTTTVGQLVPAPIGLTLTAQLRDNDETLAVPVVVAPVLDRDGEALHAYEATFTAPATLPVELVWLEGAVVVATEPVEARQPLAASGGDWFTNDELRGILDAGAVYTDVQIAAARAQAQEDLEEACGVSFTPVAFTETLSGTGATSLYLDAYPIISVDTPAGTTWGDDGEIFSAAGWVLGWRNITVTGVAGYASPPLRVRRAAMLLAKRYLVPTKVSDRATIHTTPDGTTDYLVTAGVRGAIFDVPEANAVVRRYGVRAGKLLY